MHKYHFDVHVHQKRVNNAGSKATRDCRTILLNSGYIDITLSFNKGGVFIPLQLIKLIATLAYYFIIIQPKSFVIVQYPLSWINRYFKYYLQLLKVKGCKFCCIIHDVDSLRSPYNPKRINKELKALSVYNAVISHNSSMSAWLRENGYKGHIKEIFLFDYLVDNNKEKGSVRGENPSIAFAGNLGRGNFLSKFADTITSYNLNLYGPFFNKSIAESNDKIKWYGSFSTEDIINEVNGDFGLIWDGDSTEEITGLMGNYIRYNTPHKTSLYLAAGLPVIISANAAIAPFIVENFLGVCINTLSDIPMKAFTIGEEEYNKVKENVLLIGEKLRNGEFLKNAVIKTENFFINHEYQE